MHGIRKNSNCLGLKWSPWLDFIFQKHKSKDPCTSASNIEVEVQENNRQWRHNRHNTCISTDFPIV